MICISAIFGNYDKPKPAPLETSYLFTESELTAKSAGTLGWIPKVVVNKERSNRYSSRVYKISPHLVGFDEDDILWIDSSLRWRGANISALFEQVEPGGIGIFPHSLRTCIYDEGRVCQRLFKREWIERAQPVEQQAEKYRKDGHPEEWGLWETTLLVWRGAQHRIGTAWLAEVLAWTNRDQISLPYIARKLEQPITTLGKGTVYQNEWFSHVRHGA